MSEGAAGDPASIHWDPDGQPVASHFDDIYFSRTDGLAESRHVFLQHNRLARRFTALAPGAGFTVGETGFGSGLNFLAAWQLWQNTAPPGARLHFVSVEKYPLARPDLVRALALWPELAPLARELIDAYPVCVGTGFHRLVLAGGRVQLTLIIDDAATGLGQLQVSDHPLFASAGPGVNAWFLDGFAPAKNPAMWSRELFLIIGHLSGPGTTAATFSAAGPVKRGLQAAGFQVKKVPGFGRKREMICGKRPENDNQLSFSATDYVPARGGKGKVPWETPWQLSAARPKAADKNALVIGAGLAGCHSARALAERGWQVTVLERGQSPAAEASGNRQGILYARLSPRPEPQGAFNLASLQFAKRHYRSFWRDAGAGSACGVLQLMDDTDREALRPLFGRAADLVALVDRREAGQLAGVPLPRGGLYFPDTGWLAPRRVCETLLDHPRIALRLGAEVHKLEETESGWHALDTRGQRLAEAPVAIIANANAARALAQTDHLPLKAIRGQVSHLPASNHSRQLQTVICAQGYLAPEVEGLHCAGATFNLGETKGEVRAQDHRANLDKLAAFGPEVARWFTQLDPTSLEGRVAFRCTTPDYLPLVGPAPIPEDFGRDFAALGKNAKSDIARPGRYRPGLYINVGHGSRGLAYAPLCAELLATQIVGELPPLPRDLIRALSPARFIIRDLVRGRSVAI